jgi:ABC-type lipoprotein release transport system permease subunit
MGQLFKLAWRSIWRQKRRTAITVASIAFGLFFIISMAGLQEGALRDAINKGARLQAGHITIEHQDYRTEPSIDLFVRNAEGLAADVGGLQQTDAVKLVIAGEGVARSGAGAFGIAIAGVSPDVERAESLIAEEIIAGDYLEVSDESKVVIGAILAERLKLKPGKKLVIAANDINGQLVERLYRVKGVFRTGTDEIDGALIQMGISAARELFNMPDSSATQVGVVLHDLDRLSSFLPIVERALANREKLSAHSWQTIMPGLSGFIALKRAGYYVMGGILIVLVLFTILNTLLMSVTERKKEFATVLALGGKARDLRLQIFFEAVIIGAIGVAVGAGFGALFTGYFSTHVIDLTAYAGGGEDIAVSGVPVALEIYTLFSEQLLATLSIFVFIATMVLSLVPISRVTRLSLANLLR